MTTVSRTAVLSLALLLCVSRAAAERPELVPLPLPDLSSMEDATRHRLEALQERVVELGPSATDADLGEAYGTLGMYYIAHHLNDAAEAALINASHLQPDELRWPYYLGFVYKIVGKLDLEQKVYERALELSPDDVPTLIHLGQLDLELGDNEKAERRYRRVLELSPAEAAAFYGLGRAAGALGRPEEAVEYFTKALELQPEATIVHYQLALAYRRLGDMDHARAHLERRGDREVGFADPLLNAIEPLKKENVVEAVIEMASAPERYDDRSVAVFAASYVAEVPQARDRIGEAIEALAPEAADLDPSSKAAARNRLARARLRLAAASLSLGEGDLGGARREVEEAVALVPEMVEASLMLGFVLERAGDVSSAVERYSAALRVDPGNIEALRSRANANLELHNNREAIVDLERLCDLGFERDGVRIRLAVAYLRLGEFETARDHCRKALQLNLDPSDAAQVHHYLGFIEFRIGSAERAVEEYRTALALDPGLVAARLDLGSALYRLGQYGESAEAYRQVVDVDPSNVRAIRGEAEALASQGRSRDARRLLEEGWHAMPESVELLHALARLLASADDPEVRDGERAVDLARRTLRAGTTPSRLETLAMASAEAGNFEEAVRLQRRVIQMATWEDRANALPRLEANLARYQTGQTCCAP